MVTPPAAVFVPERGDAAVRVAEAIAKNLGFRKKRRTGWEFLFCEDLNPLNWPIDLLRQPA